MTVDVGLALPTGVVAVGDDHGPRDDHVRPVTATRTFDAGLRLVGTRSDFAYDARQSIASWSRSADRRRTSTG